MWSNVSSHFLFYYRNRMHIKSVVKQFTYKSLAATLAVWNQGPLWSTVISLLFKPLENIFQLKMTEYYITLVIV